MEECGEEQGHAFVVDDEADSEDVDLKEALQKKRWEYKNAKYQACFECKEIFNEVKDPKLSIVIIAWRLHPNALKNVRALQRQRKSAYELVFVNNGAHRDEFDVLFPYIDTYVCLNRNTGVCLSRNIGSVFAKATILLFMDDDGIPDDCCLQPHLEAFDSYDVITVRGKVLPLDQSVLNGPRKRVYTPGNVPFPCPTDMEADLSIAADAFFNVGGWNDTTFIGGEGVELSLRLLKRYPDMRKQVYWPESIIYHNYALSHGEYEMKNTRIL